MLDKPVRLNVTEKKSTVKFSSFFKKFVLMFQVIELSRNSYILRGDPKYSLRRRRLNW